MSRKLDRRLRLVNRLTDRYYPQIGELFNRSTPAVSIGYGDPGVEGAVAGTSGGSITFDPKYLKTASRRDLRGALIHELTHAVGMGSQGGNPETFADFARLVLNPKEASYWEPSKDVLAMAEKRGVDVAGYTGTQGPKHGNSNKNTVVNGASKGTPPPPLLGPGAYVQSADASAQNLTTLYERLASLKAAKGQVRATAIQGRADAKALGIEGVTHNVNEMLDRGIRGSSVDALGEQSALADMERAKQDVIRQRTEGMLGLTADRIGAFNDFYSTQFGIQSAQAADQSQASIEAFLNDMILGLMGGPGGGGAGSGPSGGKGQMTPEMAAKTKAYIEKLVRLGG